MATCFELMHFVLCAVQPGQISMDAQLFGMGCCGLQVSSLKLDRVARLWVIRRAVHTTMRSLG